MLDWLICLDWEDESADDGERVVEEGAQERQDQAGGGTEVKVRVSVVDPFHSDVDPDPIREILDPDPIREIVDPDPTPLIINIIYIGKQKSNLFFAIIWYSYNLGRFSCATRIYTGSLSWFPNPPHKWKRSGYGSGSSTLVVDNSYW